MFSPALKYILHLHYYHFDKLHAITSANPANKYRWRNFRTLLKKKPSGMRDKENRDFREILFTFATRWVGRT